MRSISTLPDGALLSVKYFFDVLDTTLWDYRLFRGLDYADDIHQHPDYQTEAFESGAALGKLPSWPVSISYFDTGVGGETTPSYELTFQLYANGVSRKLRIDYGDFTLRGTLSSLEIFKAPKCR